MLPFKIALRFLTHGKMQTILIVVGIAVAVSIQIFVGLLINSLQQTLVDRTIGNSPQISITPANDVPTIRDWRRYSEIIERLGATKAIAASASANAFVQDGNNQLPVLARGFAFEKADQIYHISNAIYEGKPYRSPREALIGRELRDELELKVGDALTIVTPSGFESSFTISGFYDLGVANINKTWVITNLQTVQQIFDLGNRATSIELSINDVFQANSIAAQLRRILDSRDIKIESWQEQNRELLSGLQGQQASSIVIQVVIIISMISGIASVLVISVFQKSRELGILKAMGIKDAAASLIFIYEGFLIGLIGSIIGILLGLGLLLSFNAFNVNAAGKPLVDLYIDYDFILLSWLIVVVCATLAAIIPARKSLQLNPIDVIREG